MFRCAGWIQQQAVWWRVYTSESEEGSFTSDSEEGAYTPPTVRRAPPTSQPQSGGRPEPQQWTCSDPNIPE